MPLLGFSVLALLTASPALAFSGSTVVHALRAPALSSQTVSKTSKSSCQVGPGHDTKKGQAVGVLGTAKKPGSAACEMPPRTQYLPNPAATEGAGAAAVG